MLAGEYLHVFIDMSETLTSFLARFIKKKQCTPVYVLHPDTMLPVDLNSLPKESKISRRARPTSSSMFSSQGAWDLGIDVEDDGKVLGFRDDSPASRAELVFESKVAHIIYRFSNLVQLLRLFCTPRLMHRLSFERY